MSFHRCEIEEPIYRSRILFLVGGDELAADAEAREWFKMRGESTQEADVDSKGASGRTFRGTNRHFVVWRDDITDKGTMAHELIHVGVAVLCDVGIPINEETDEALAYYIDWMADNCPAHLPIISQ